MSIIISLQVEFNESLMMISGLFAVMVLSVLTGMSHMVVILLDIFIVCHRLWLVLIPVVYNLDIMILTDVPVEICCSFIVPGDIFCFG